MVVDACMDEINDGDGSLPATKRVRSLP